MKQRAVIPVVLGVLLTLMVGFQMRAGAESEKSTSNGSASTTVGDRDHLLAARDKLTASTEKIATFKASEALNEIEKNITLLKSVREKVEAAENIDSVIDEVADALDSMATSYEHIASMKKEIELTYKAEFRSLDDVALGTGRTLTQIRTEKTRCQTEIAEAEKALPNTTDANDQRKLDITIRALRSQENQWSAKETIWLKFTKKQKEIKNKLSISGEQVDMLVFLLEKNAIVYRGAASVARLRKSAKDTLKNLGGFEDLNDAAGSLVGTWSELDGIVDRMAADDFLEDIGEE